MPPADAPPAVSPHIEYVAKARAALEAAGLEKRELDGTVYYIAVPRAASSSGSSVPRAQVAEEPRNRGTRTYVLVHGVNDHAGTWAAVAPKLANDHRVIAIDLPGHGESASKEGPISMPLMLERLHAVIEKEARGKVTLVGSSMGGCIGVLYAIAHPERVEHLVLESGGGLARAPGVPLFAQTREDAVRILRAVHGPDAATPDWAIDTLLAMNDKTPMARVLASGLMPFFTDGKLSQVKVRTTIVWGEHDGVVPRAYVDDLHKGIAASALCVIEGAAHIPHTQQPERFLACLTSSS